jgi:hypothetical protein
MSKKVSVPGPSQQETQALQTQTELLQKQQAQIDQQLKMQNLLAPILYKQLGLQAQMDEQGNITGFTESADSQAQTAQNKQIEDLLGKRSLAALKGELPADQGLLNELTKQEDTLKASLAKNLGSDYATSTPGIQALGEFNKNKSAILDAASRADISLSESLGLARQGSNVQTTGSLLSGATGINDQNSLIAQLFGQNAQGYAPQLNYFNAIRQMKTQARMASAQNATSFNTSLLRTIPSLIDPLGQGGVGSGGGAAGIGSMFSSLAAFA